MRLQKAIFFNRAPFNKLELNFDDSNIFVLSGINGKGKTTVLSYIVDSFYELAKQAFQNEFENIANKFYRVSSFLSTLDSTKPSIVYLRYTDKGHILDYIDLRGDCSKEVYNAIINLDEKIPFESIRKSSLVSKIWSVNNKNEIQDLFSKNLLTYFPAYRYETPSYLNDPYKIKLKFHTNLEFSGYLPNPIEVISDIDAIANWIMDVQLDVKLYPESFTPVESQLNIILNSILKNKISTQTRIGIGARYNSAQRIAVTDAKGNAIYPNIYVMSSGELALFSLFAELARQTDIIYSTIPNITGIVLVDEIEEHLHIKLQKEILPELLSMFPNLQFVVTSHSPFLSLGLAESRLKYHIFDFDNNAILCEPQDNSLFKEVYNILITENENYAKRYNDLSSEIAKSTTPLIITEGKTDWKHIRAAMKALRIKDLNIEFYEYEDTLGDSKLLSLLEDYARISQKRKIIGIFDRDNEQIVCKIEQNNKLYYALGNNVFAFCVPTANQDVYGKYTSIEHYYKRENLLKEDENHRRLFLGEEFYESGNSKDLKCRTRIKGIANKVMVNGIIDEKVYNAKTDPEEKHSIAMSKKAYASKIYEEDAYADGFDFSEFNKIFELLRKICNES